MPQTAYGNVLFLTILVSRAFHGSRPEPRVGSEHFQDQAGRFGSGRVGSGRVGSGRVGSGRVGSGRVRRFLNLMGRVGSGCTDPT